MIKFLTWIMMLLMDIFMIVVLSCATVLGLAVLDYVLDTDLKDALVLFLGKREGLKHIRQRVEQIIQRIDRKELEHEADKLIVPVRVPPEDDSWYQFD